MKARLELISNAIFIVGVAVFSVWALPQALDRWRGAPRSLPPTPYASGEAAPLLPTVSYAENASQKTVVLFVRSSCPYCTKSMAFYGKLLASEKHAAGRFKIVVVSDESVGITGAYLKDHNIAPDRVVSAPFVSTTKIRSTPTLLIVNSQGLISDVRIGEQNDLSQEQIITSL